MKSKRIINNSNIHNQIICLEAEFLNKLTQILDVIVLEEKLDVIEFDYIVMMKFCVTLRSTTVAWDEYSDRNDRNRNYVNHLIEYKYYFEYINNKANKPLIKLYNEYSEKISILAKEIRLPKKFLTLSNFETQEEYDKLLELYNNKYIKGIIDIEFAKNFDELLDKRAHELKLITIGDKIKNESKYDKMFRRKVLKLISSGTEITSDILKEIKNSIK